MHPLHRGRTLVFLDHKKRYELLDRKMARFQVKTSHFCDFLVEISGIEPLTS